MIVLNPVFLSKYEIRDFQFEGLFDINQWFIKSLAFQIESEEIAQKQSVSHEA
jgi:hypothetical protein